MSCGSIRYCCLERVRLSTGLGRHASESSEILVFLLEIGGAFVAQEARSRRRGSETHLLLPASIRRCLSRRLGHHRAVAGHHPARFVFWLLLS